MVFPLFSNHRNNGIETLRSQSLLFGHLPVLPMFPSFGYSIFMLSSRIDFTERSDNMKEIDNNTDFDRVKALVDASDISMRTLSLVIPSILHHNFSAAGRVLENVRTLFGCSDFKDEFHCSTSP